MGRERVIARLIARQTQAAEAHTGSRHVLAVKLSLRRPAEADAVTADGLAIAVGTRSSRNGGLQLRSAGHHCSGAAVIHLVAGAQATHGQGLGSDFGAVRGRCEGVVAGFTTIGAIGQAVGHSSGAGAGVLAVEETTRSRHRDRHGLGTYQAVQRIAQGDVLDLRGAVIHLAAHSGTDDGQCCWRDGAAAVGPVEAVVASCPAGQSHRAHLDSVRPCILGRKDRAACHADGIEVAAQNPHQAAISIDAIDVNVGRAVIGTTQTRAARQGDRALRDREQSTVVGDAVVARAALTEYRCGRCQHMAAARTGSGSGRTGGHRCASDRVTIDQAATGHGDATDGGIGIAVLTALVGSRQRDGTWVNGQCAILVGDVVVAGSTCDEGLSAGHQRMAGTGVGGRRRGRAQGSRTQMVTEGQRPICQQDRAAGRIGIAVRPSLVLWLDRDRTRGDRQVVACVGQGVVIATVTVADGGSTLADGIAAHVFASCTCLTDRERIARHQTADAVGQHRIGVAVDLADCIGRDTQGAGADGAV